MEWKIKENKGRDEVKNMAKANNNMAKAKNDSDV